jgi:hypothetical protein
VCRSQRAACLFDIVDIPPKAPNGLALLLLYDNCLAEIARGDCEAICVRELDPSTVLSSSCNSQQPRPAAVTCEQAGYGRHDSDSIQRLPLTAGRTVI